MSHPTLFSYPRPRVDIAEVPAVSHAGAVLLTDTLHSTGLAHSLREALDPSTNRWPSITPRRFCWTLR